MKIFQKVWEIWSGQESVTDRLTDLRTEKGHSYNPTSVCSRGLKLQTNEVFFAQNKTVPFVQVIHFQMLTIVGTLKFMARLISSSFPLQN